MNPSSLLISRSLLFHRSTAFASRMQGPRQRGLFLAAAVWGVVGYAIGTTIGVFLYKTLLQTIPLV